jgi:NAD(P)-dependent dehydrogenase (short-subunit alcohol dehydrogenase family)
MDLGIAGKVVFFTGGSKGMGRIAARMGRPEEIASMIVYLCSELAGYVNGAWIEVDGAHHRSAF